LERVSADLNIAARDCQWSLIGLHFAHISIVTTRLGFRLHRTRRRLSSPTFDLLLLRFAWRLNACDWRLCNLWCEEAVVAFGFMQSFAHRFNGDMLYFSSSILSSASSAILCLPSVPALQTWWNLIKRRVLETTICRTVLSHGRRNGDWRRLFSDTYYGQEDIFRCST
jgi:hypothetical protein